MKPRCPFLPLDASSCRFSCVMIFVLCITCLAACTKNLPACTGNCATVTFSGKVTDLSTGQPIKNVPVKVYLFHDENGLFDIKPDILAASGGTKNDGTFSFSPEINTGYFNTYTTGVNAYIPDGYLEYPITGTGSGFQKPLDYDSYTFYRVYDSAGFRHLNYGFYEQTKLQVHVHRTSAFTPASLVTYDFSLSGTQAGSGAAFTESAGNKDTTISVLTAANIVTIITRIRALPGATSTDSARDSVRCTKEGPNTIDVYY